MIDICPHLDLGLMLNSCSKSYLMSKKLSDRFKVYYVDVK